MGRTVSTDLQNLLDLTSCTSQTTLDLYLQDTSEFHVATDALEIDSVTYSPELRQSEELKQSMLRPIDRVNVVIQNVDKVFGETVTDEDLVRAEGVVGRYYIDSTGELPSVWVELFRGEVRPTNLDEKEAKLEILHDLAAAGYCVGEDTLAEPCQWVFKDAGTCGYSGGETLCNKKRKSLDGCEGRENEQRFGGMEFPGNQIPSPPAIITGGGGGGGGNCPRIDQWIPCRGDNGEILMRRAMAVFANDWLYCPKCLIFHRVKSAEMVEGERIWRLSTAAAISGHSSFSHPVYPSIDHEGVQVRSVANGDDLLCWHREKNEIMMDRVDRSHSNGEIGNVIRIELDCECKTYAYGDRKDVLIVCHNSIPIKEL